VKRVIKNPEIRRQEIILAAGKLFEKMGYAGTSVAAVIEKVGIAKGTFYHYFDSKQDVLIAMVDDIVKALELHYQDILVDEKMSSKDKLKELLVGSKKKKIVHMGVMKVLHMPENRELQERLNVESINTLAPLIADVMVQGYENGEFKRKVSIANVQVVLSGIQFIMDSGLFEWSKEEKKEYMQEIQKLSELLVGAKKGEFNFIVTGR
jgi:AcrR family transcriptional regulator